MVVVLGVIWRMLALVMDFREVMRTSPPELGHCAPSPPVPYPHWPKLIILTLRIFFIRIWDPLPLALIHFFFIIKINNISFLLLFKLFLFFLIVIARYRLNTTKYLMKEPKKASESA